MAIREDERVGLDRDTGKLDRNARVRVGKVVGMVVGGMAVMVLLAALALPYFAGVNKYHRQVQSQLEKSLGRKASLVHMDVRFLPPSLRAENAVISEDSRFKTDYTIATADRLTMSVR